MATRHLLLPVLLFFLSSASGNPEPSYPEKETKLAQEVVVDGVVLCQSCKQAGTWSLTGARPLPLAKVGISCKDHKNRVKYYKAVKTDSGGYFYAPLEGLDLDSKKYYLDHPIHGCTVHLLSSPDKACNLLTNINSGIEGAELRDENKKVSGRSYGAVIYTAGPLAFRPAHCLPTIHY